MQLQHRIRLSANSLPSAPLIRRCAPSPPRGTGRRNGAATCASPSSSFGLSCFCRSDASREAGPLAATASIAILLGRIAGICLIANITVKHALRASRLPSLLQKQELRDLRRSCKSDADRDCWGDGFQQRGSWLNREALLRTTEKPKHALRLFCFIEWAEGYRIDLLSH